MKPTIILIHGIWMTGLEMSWLKRRLLRKGYRVLTFRYHSIKQPFSKNINKLHQFLSQQTETDFDFVCHSLGGLLLLTYLQTYRLNSNTKIILLGSPVNGSYVARYLASKTHLKLLLGNSDNNILLQGIKKWPSALKLGIIAGNRAFGVGRIIPGMKQPSDGTISLDETTVPDPHERVILKTSHMGLVFSKTVVQYINTFLETGKFK